VPLEFDTLSQSVYQWVNTLLPAVELFYMLYQCLISIIAAGA